MLTRSTGIDYGDNEQEDEEQIGPNEIPFKIMQCYSYPSDVVNQDEFYME